MKEHRDITGDIGNLYANSSPSVPMYSFSRPAYLFWQGVYAQMIDKGYTHDAAIEFLQSKNARWMLDGFGQELITLGSKMFNKYMYPRNKKGN